MQSVPGCIPLLRVGTINWVQQKEIGRLSGRHREQARLLQKQSDAHPLPFTTQQAER
jgi:hypothetical protein